MSLVALVTARNTYVDIGQVTKCASFREIIANECQQGVQRRRETRTEIFPASSPRCDPLDRSRVPAPM
jgi:hypothetical protein